MKLLLVYLIGSCICISSYGMNKAPAQEAPKTVMSVRDSVEFEWDFSDTPTSELSVDEKHPNQKENADAEWIVSLRESRKRKWEQE